MKTEQRKLHAFRLSKKVWVLLSKWSLKTGKTKTRLVEEALLLHVGQER